MTAVSAAESLLRSIDCDSENPKTTSDAVWLDDGSIGGGGGRGG